MKTDLQYATPDLPAHSSGVEMQCDLGSVDIPRIEREVNTGWLTEALSAQHPGVEVTDRTIDKVIAGNSAKVWVRMRYNEAGGKAGLPPVMVMKAGFSRQTELVDFGWELECEAYRDMLPRYPINAPKCFYAGRAPDGRTGAVMIEDLNVRGVRFGHASRPLSYEDAANVMEMWAAFHAKSWNDPALSDGSFAWATASRRNIEALRIYTAALLEEENWNSFLALPRGGAIPRILHDRERFAEAFGRLEAAYDEQPQVAMMGDEHLGNIMFDRDGTPGVYDLQCRVGPWARSIAYFLNVAVDVQDRRKWDRALIAHYLAGLAAHGITPPSFDDAFDAYAREALFGYLIWFGNNSSMQTEWVNACNTVRHAWAIIDNETFRRLGVS